jgi:hypothetical protein
LISRAADQARALDQQHAVTSFGEYGSEVDGDGCFAHAAFLIEHSDYHCPIPDESHLRFYDITIFPLYDW